MVSASYEVLDKETDRCIRADLGLDGDKTTLCENPRGAPCGKDQGN